MDRADDGREQRIVLQDEIHPGNGHGEPVDGQEVFVGRSDVLRRIYGEHLEPDHGEAGSKELPLDGPLTDDPRSPVAVDDLPKGRRRKEGPEPRGQLGGTPHLRTRDLHAVAREFPGFPSIGSFFSVVERIGRFPASSVEPEEGEHGAAADDAEHQRDFVPDLHGTDVPPINPPVQIRRLENLHPGFGFLVDMDGTQEEELLIQHQRPDDLPVQTRRSADSNLVAGRHSLRKRLSGFIGAKERRDSDGR